MNETLTLKIIFVTNALKSHSKCHLFMYSQKNDLCETADLELSDNRIFKALLWIKESFKSIDFDLAKHVLVSTSTPFWTWWVNFDWSGIIYLKGF